MKNQEQLLISKLYDRRMQSVAGSGRAAYDEIRLSANICPYCSFGEVYEVDHFLPKATFADLNVLPLNLVPICHPCNHIKLEMVPQGADSHLLHPYFDILPETVRWLFAQIDFMTGGPVLRYWVDLDETLYGALAQRLRYHFRKLHLERRFGVMATSVLGELEDEISEYLSVLGPIQMQAHFENRAETLFARRGNTLETAAYFAAAASQAYCAGGYRS